MYAKRRSILHLFIGLTIGLGISFILKSIISPCSLKLKTSNENENPLPEHKVLKYSKSINRENESRKLVLIGVMTARKYITTRAVAVYETWAKNFHGKVLFFTGENVTTGSDGDDETGDLEIDKLRNSEFPLIFLPDVDDSYPPQKKSFMMLKYMYDHYGSDFEWFMRADDDLFIRTDKLSKFLRSINSNDLHFIGQAGRGNHQEFGTLDLGINDNFCMGGPGIIMSQPTLSALVPHIPHCLRNMYSTHEDVEVGRCIQKFIGISCTWAYEMQKLFYHNYSGEKAFTESLKLKEVHEAITLHPVKNYQNMYRLFSYFQSLVLEDLLIEKMLIQRDLLTSHSENTLCFDPVETSGDKIRTAIDCDLKVTGLPPSLNKFIPRTQSDILPWDYMGNLGFHSANFINPRQRLDTPSKESLQDVIEELVGVVNDFARSRGRIVEIKDLLYGYRRINPMFGEDFVLDVLLSYKKYRGRKSITTVRRHAYIQRQFSSLQTRISSSLSPPNISDNRRSIVMIVSLSGRLDTLIRFLKNFAYVCKGLPSLISDEFSLDFTLVIVYFGLEDQKLEFSHMINKYRVEISETQSDVYSCQIKAIQLDGEFSRGKALETGISLCNDNDLIFLIDVDIVFSPSAVRRVLINTVRNTQVYFPIVFSEYNPTLFTEELKGSNAFQVSTDRGYWRTYGYGIASFYKSDFRAAGGFDTSIKGWGKEDVTLFDRFINLNIKVFRGPDPELLHIYHPVHCDVKLQSDQYKMCLGTQYSTLGSVESLARYILKNSNLTDII